jgi:hypothetical protein
MNDDAYFYLKVALNHSQGLGSTFSGLAPTNGYHPLWQWLLWWLFDVTHPTVMGGLFQARALSLAFMGLSLWLLWHFARAAFGARWAAACVAMLSVFATRGTYCVEFWVLAACVCGLLCTGLRSESPWTDALFAGPLLAAVILARLDAVLLAPCWIVADAVRWLRQDGRLAAAKYAIVALLIIVATLLAYVHHNHEHFGHDLTISAMLKSTFPVPRLPTGQQLRHMTHCLPGVVAATIALVALIRTGRSDRVAQVVLIASAWAILHALAVTFFTRWPAFGIWWWLPSYLSLALALGYFGSRHLGPRSAAAVVVAVCVWQAGALTDAMVYYPDAPEGEMGSKYAQAIPENAVAFQVDATGMTSYLSDRTVINGDGLMNNLEYQNAVARGKLLDYFAKYGVTHIVHDEVDALDPEVAGGTYPFASLTVPAHLYGIAVTLHMPRQWETARWTVVWPGQHFPWPRHRHIQTLVAWRLPEIRDAWAQMLSHPTASK